MGATLHREDARALSNPAPDVESDAEFIRRVRQAVAEDLFVKDWLPKLIELAARGADRKSGLDPDVVQIFGERFAWERS